MPDRVQIGTPITVEQAARAVLRMIDSPIMGDVSADSSPGHTFHRLHKQDDDAGATPYDLLSSGEQKLVDIAFALWRAPYAEGACINVLGGLDRDARRKVLVVLTYFYLGRDLSLLEADQIEWRALFAPPEPSDG